MNCFVYMFRKTALCGFKVKREVNKFVTKFNDYGFKTDLNSRT